MTLRQVRHELERMGFTYDGWGKNLKYRSPKGKLLTVSSSPKHPSVVYSKVIRIAEKMLKAEGT